MGSVLSLLFQCLDHYYGIDCNLDLKGNIEVAHTLLRLAIFHLKLPGKCSVLGFDLRK